MNNPSIVAELVQLLSPELLEDYEERAAIMEFEGELPKIHAEALALLDVLRRHPDALLGLDLFVLTRNGETRYLLSERDRLDPQRLRTIGYEVTTPISLHVVLQEAFNGIAMLISPRSQGDRADPSTL